MAGPKGWRTLIGRSQPLFGHATLLPFVEAYIIVFELLVRLRPGETLSEAECVAQGLVEGNQAYLLRRISSESAIGKILFENGYKLAANLGLAGVTDDRVLAERRAMTIRMERMRIELLKATMRDDDGSEAA